MHVDRERLIRTLTFWLRPDFILRIVGRFQKVAGFDRAIALASSALTAIIPLAIVVSAIATKLGGKDTAQRLIDRYNLTGGGADAVKAMFSPAPGDNTSIGIIGVLFLLLAVLSFTRAMQRLFEQTWELKPLSVRNTFNGLRWIVGLSVFLTFSGWLHSIFGRSSLDLAPALISIPLTVVFFVWTAWVLSAKRIPWQDLIPYGITSAIVYALVQVGLRVYMPHLFSSYATRYGVIGAVFAMISGLFVIMVAMVGVAAAGREVHDELGRIRRGERPADDEVKRQWDAIIADGRTRWETFHEEVDRRRAARRERKKPSAQS